VSGDEVACPPKRKEPSEAILRERWWQPAFFVVAKYTVKALFKVWLRTKVVGKRNVPMRGGLLVVSNHASYLDPPLIGVSMPRRCWFMARSTLFKNRFFGALIAGLGSFPVERAADRGVAGSGDIKAIRTVLEQLELGHPVLLFPEGSRSATGEMERFQRGVAVLLKRSKCPVLPVAVSGVYDAWPRGKKPRLFVPKRVVVRFGEAIEHDELLKDGGEAAVKRLEGVIGGMLGEIERGR
jgi:1-acyl-sn-glycerol-3-phosphate acyltransferase